MKGMNLIEEMKRIILALFVTVSFFLFFGCSKREKDLKFDLEKNINLVPIAYPDLLGTSMQLIKKDSLLMINDFVGDSLIHLFDLQKKILVKKLIPVGNGPGELISPLEIHLSGNRLWVFCRQSYTMYSIPGDSLVNGNKNMTNNFKLSSEVNHLYPLTDSIFISSGFFQKRYVLFNYLGEKINEFEEYPSYWDKEKSYSSQVRAMFHQTSFEKHPQKALFVACSSHTLEIYDYSERVENPKLLKQLLLGKYNYSFINDGTIFSVNGGDDVERGVVHVACSSKHIYMVYDLNCKNNNNSGVQIQVIDWNGNPVKIINSEKNISCLTIDEKEQRGYVIYENPNDELAYFNL